MEKFLYIGSGLDIEPIVHFCDVKEFVFIDTLPRSEFDGYIFNGSLFYDGFYRHKFIDLLIEKISKYGFELVEKILLDQEYYLELLPQDIIGKKTIYTINNFLTNFPNINPSLMIFINKKTLQTIKYYISTNILVNMCDKLKKDIIESTGMIISGYHPDKIILDYLSSPIKLYCYTSTCYYLDDEEVDDFNNIIYWTFNNPDKVKTYFNKIFVCDRTNGNLFECENMFQVDETAKKIRNTYDDNCIF